MGSFSEATFLNLTLQHPSVGSSVASSCWSQQLVLWHSTALGFIMKSFQHDRTMWVVVSEWVMAHNGVEQAGNMEICGREQRVSRWVSRPTALIA